MCISIYIYTYIHVYEHKYAIRVSVHKHTQAHTHTHTQEHTHAQIYAHTYQNTRRHTFLLLQKHTLMPKTDVTSRILCLCLQICFLMKTKGLSFQTKNTRVNSMGLFSKKNKGLFLQTGKRHLKFRFRPQKKPNKGQIENKCWSLFTNIRNM